jgi:hypothetical protein
MNCSICSKKFTRKTFYDRHVLVCELISKSQKKRKIETEERNDIPSPEKMYEILLEMTVKYKKMEEKVERLSTMLEAKNKKINILDWLNTTYTSCEPFDSWVKKIVMERKHLEYIFNNDFVCGMTLIYKELLSDVNKEKDPIKSFEQKDNTLIVFNGKEWEYMGAVQFEKMTDVIYKQVFHEFVLWQNENKHRMYDDDYAITYMKNLKKINGGNTSTEQLYAKIHRELYKHLKTNIRQYDVCF